MYEEMAEVTMRKAGGNLVYCRECGAVQIADHRLCLREGWPKCCGYTMTIDPPHPKSEVDDAV